MVPEERLMKIDELAEVRGWSECVLWLFDLVKVYALFRQRSYERWFKELEGLPDEEANLLFFWRSVQTDKNIWRLISKPGVLQGYKIAIMVALDELEAWIRLKVLGHYRIMGFKDKVRAYRLLKRIREFIDVVSGVRDWGELNGLFERYRDEVHFEVEWLFRRALEVLLEGPSKVYELEPRPCELMPDKRECPYRNICTEMCGRKLSEIPYPVKEIEEDPYSKEYSDESVRNTCPFCGYEGPVRFMLVKLEPVEGFTYGVGYLVCPKCERIIGEY